MYGEKYIVDGFLFATEEEAKAARNESEGVKYMRGRTDMNNPASVYAVYCKIIEKNLFKTPIGFSYLHELRETLNKNDEYREKIKSLAVKVPKISSKKRYSEQKKEEKLTRKQLVKSMKELDIESVYRNRFVNSVILNIILVIVIAVVMLIASNSKNVNIINYKNRIDAEYSQKEDALIKWQNQLKEKEELLKIQDTE